MTLSFCQGKNPRKTITIACLLLVVTQGSLVVNATLANPTSSTDPTARASTHINGQSDKVNLLSATDDLKPKEEPLEQPGSSNLERPGVKETIAAAHYALSDFYFNQWKLNLCEAELEEAIMYWPNFEAAHRRLCLVSLFSGKFARSLAELMMGVGLGEAIPLNDAERAELNKRAVVLHYNRGVEQARHSKWKDAIAEFKWALVYGPREAIVHRSLAFAYAREGNFTLAEIEYELSTQYDPTDAFAHADFAFLLAEKGQPERAAQQMSEAVKYNPSVAALHVDMGWMAESRGDWKTAGKQFQEAVKLSPNHGWLWAHLGKVLEHQGKSHEAINAYSKAVTLDPKQDEAQQRLTQLKLQAPS